MTAGWTARALVSWDDGFSIPAAGFWLDPRRPVEFGFASDGHGEALAHRILATPETVRFLRRRRRPSFLPSPLGRSFAMGEADVRLIPAGGMLGAAQIVLRYRGGTVLYFRRVLPEKVGLGEALETPRADAVLIDAPGGVAPQACARRGDTLSAIRAWVESVLQRNEIPALLAEPLAAAPALVASLAVLGCEMRLQGSVYTTVRTCIRLGVKLQRAWPLRGGPRIGQLVVLPWDERPGREQAGAAAEGASGGETRAVKPLMRLLGSASGGDGPAPRVRVGVVHDGSAPLPADLRPDEEFLLAFTAGVPEIVSHVQRTGASEALLSPWTPAVVGTVLRDLGVAVVTRLGPPEQLGLGVKG